MSNKGSTTQFGDFLHPLYFHFLSSQKTLSSRISSKSFFNCNKTQKQRFTLKPDILLDNNYTRSACFGRSPDWIQQSVCRLAHLPVHLHISLRFWDHRRQPPLKSTSWKDRFPFCLKLRNKQIL